MRISVMILETASHTGADQSSSWFLVTLKVGAVTETPAKSDLSREKTGAAFRDGADLHRGEKSGPRGLGT